MSHVRDGLFAFVLFRHSGFGPVASYTYFVLHPFDRNLLTADKNGVYPRACDRRSVSVSIVCQFDILSDVNLPLNL